MRKRRSNRSAHPCRLDEAVMLFRGLEPGETEISGRYWTISLRIAQELVAAGEAERIDVDSEHNGTFVAFVETELGAVLRNRGQRKVRDASCQMGPRVMEQAAIGTPKFTALVEAWSNGRHTPAVRQRCRQQGQQPAVVPTVQAVADTCWRMAA